jgi:hypothetical protein
VEALVSAIGSEVRVEDWRVCDNIQENGLMAQEMRLLKAQDYST